MTASKLTWLEKDKSFLFLTADKTLAKKVRNDGWGRTAMGGSLKPGQFALYNKEAYAALDHFGAADDEAKARLDPLAREYRTSLARTSSFRVSAPDTLPDWLQPLDFQRAGVEYAVARPNSLIGDDPGLTKTAQSIMACNHLQAERVLVVCPATARSQWAESIRTWSTIPRVGRGVYPIYKARYGVSPFAYYTIISYDLLRNEALHSALTGQNWDVVILDEAHYCKTVDSGRSKRALGSLDGKIKGIAECAARTIALTGTPLPNRPREAYNLARHLAWDSIDWLSEDAFTRRFNPSMKLMTGHDLEYVSRLPELRARLRCNFMVRRRKRDVLTQLPAEWHEIVHVEPNGAIRKALKEESLLNFDVDDFESLDMETRGHIAAVRHEMGIAKIPRVVEHLVMLLDGGVPKLFVVAYHRKVMEALAEKLSSFGVESIIGGQTPMRRDRAKLRFINDPSCRVLLGQINAVAEALDGLQRVCSRGVFAEASWVFKDNEQACGRLIRMGQEESVLWQYLVAPGSLDEKVLGKSIKKGQIVNTTLDS